MPEIGEEAPDLTFDVVRAAMPFLQERITSFAAYGGMSIRKILGESFQRASVREVTTLESMSFSWREGKFEGTPLPSAAQLAPAFGICIGDLDGDDVVDIDDLLLLIDNWGNPGIGDVNDDGVVDIDDLLILINHWG